jgi:hypothetical protein
MGELPGLRSLNRFLRRPVLHETGHHMDEITARPAAFIGDGKRQLRSRPFQTRENDMPAGHSFKPRQSLQDRLNAWSDEVRKQAAQLPRGPEQEVLLAKARQADAACHLEEWLNSPRLQPPALGPVYG